MEGISSLKESSTIDKQGCPFCSKEQPFYKEYIHQDCILKSDKKHKLQRHHHLWKWRTVNGNIISARFLNCILYFLVLLSRLLDDFKNHNRTFLHSIVLLYGVLLLVLLPSSSGEVSFSPQGDTKLRNAIVPVGTHFVYKIPYSIFDCNVDRLEISEGSTRSLPNWLAYSETRQELYGVASIKDIGQYDILVVSVTNSPSGTGQICGIKAFSITVSTKQTSSQTNGYDNSPTSSVTLEIPSSPTESSYFQCPGGSHSVFGTVLISANIHQLTGHQRVLILTSMASHLNVSSSKVGLYTADSGHPLLSQLDQLSVISSGSGNGRFKPGSKSLLTWLLNCGALRLSDSYLSKLETTAKDGVMSEVLGYPVVGWHITSGVMKVKHRVRRAAAATPTPQPSSTLPTRLPSSTIIINETSSLSRSSFTFSNSTAKPQTTFYASSTLPASPLLTSSIRASSMTLTHSISSITSTPVMTSIMSSTSIETVSSMVPSNSTISLDITPSATLSSSIPSTTLQPVTVTSTMVVNISSDVLSLSFLSSTVQPSTSIASENTSSYLYISSSETASFSLLPTISIQSSPVIPSTTIQEESLTVTMNYSRSITYTMPATSVLPSTPTYTMNDSSYLVTSSIQLLTSSLVLPSSSQVLLNSSSIDYQNKSSFISSSVYSSSALSISENSSAFIPKSTHSVLESSRTYSSSSLVEVSSPIPVPSSSMPSNATLSSIASSSKMLSTLSSTVFINQTSTIHPSFETSSIVLPSSTISPSISYNVTSNKTVFLSSSVNASQVESTIVVAANTSSVVSLVPSISTVPVMTTVNITSMISPTILNTSSIKATSTAPLFNTTSVFSIAPTIASRITTIGSEIIKSTVTQINTTSLLSVRTTASLNVTITSSLAPSTISSPLTNQTLSSEMTSRLVPSPTPVSSSYITLSTNLSSSEGEVMNSTLPLYSSTSIKSESSLTTNASISTPLLPSIVTMTTVAMTSDMSSPFSNATLSTAVNSTIALNSSTEYVTSTQLVNESTSMMTSSTYTITQTMTTSMHLSSGISLSTLMPSLVSSTADVQSSTITTNFTSLSSTISISITPSLLMNSSSVIPTITAPSSFLFNLTTSISSDNQTSYILPTALSNVTTSVEPTSTLMSSLGASTSMMTLLTTNQSSYLSIQSSTAIITPVTDSILSTLASSILNLSTKTYRTGLVSPSTSVFTSSPSGASTFRISSRKVTSTSVTGVSTVMATSSIYNLTISSSVYDTATVKPTTTVMETQSHNMTSTVSMATTSLVLSPSVSMVTTSLASSSSVSMATTPNSSIVSSSPSMRSSYSITSLITSLPSSVLETSSTVVMTTAPPSNSSMKSSSTSDVSSRAYSSLSSTTPTTFLSFVPSSTLNTLSISTIQSSPTLPLVPTSSASYLPNTTSIIPTSVAISSPGSTYSTQYTVTAVASYSSFAFSLQSSMTTTYPTTKVMHSPSPTESHVLSTTINVKPSSSVLKSTVVTTSDSPGRPSTMLPTSSYSSRTTSMLTPTWTNSTLTVAASKTLPTSDSPNITSFISSSTTSSPLPTTSVVTPTTKPNSPPVLKNDIGRVQVTAGIAFMYLIPADTFHDSEDGNTRSLNLTLFQVVEARARPIPTNLWLSFNAVNQTINGLPMEKDVPNPANPEVGVKFLLNARDSHGAVAYDVFEILIASSQNTAYTQSLTVTLNNNYTAFKNDVNQRLNLLNKISSYYKDPDTSQIRLLSYIEGSIVVSWVNNSLPSHECNKEKLNQIAEVVTTNNGVTTGFKEHLSPDFEATSAKRTFSGACTQTGTTSAPYITARNFATEPSGLWEKHVIPGIVVVVILIILAILLICCILRRRRAKPSDPEKRTYTKRKPIILEPEMEMKPVPSKPLILENDSPTSYPPSYLSESSLYKSPSGYYDNQVGDFDEEDNRLTPPRHSPVYETPPPSYTQPEELQEPPPPPYMLPPALLYPRYELPPWEESSEV